LGKFCKVLLCSIGLGWSLLVMRFGSASIRLVGEYLGEDRFCPSKGRTVIDSGLYHGLD
jgi:hypothetical protein